MSRQPRKLSQTGCYHIVFRGVNRCHLFEERSDFEKLLTLLTLAKEELSLEIFAYCLLDNHVHLLIRENAPGDIISAMRKILSPYAYWFNNKYQRSGALISERYKSECVESDRYLLAVVRYIHQNPLRAGITSNIDFYEWSSYRDYFGQGKGLVNTDFVMELFSDDLASAQAEFDAFHKENDGHDYSLSVPIKRSEEQILASITSVLKGVKPNAVGSYPKSERDDMLVLLRKAGFSIRQIERATGISKAIIERCR